MRYLLLCPKWLFAILCTSHHTCLTNEETCETIATKTHPMDNYTDSRLTTKKLIPNLLLIKKLACLTIFIFATLSLSAQLIYVKSGATGNGTSWADASGNLTLALANASIGTQIWVAAGIYYPTTCNSCDFTQRNTSFEIKDGVHLYGGFQGTETSIDQRDIIQYPTILSGDIDEDGLLEHNSYSVIYSKDVSAATIVDGFTIRAGHANSPNTDPGTRLTSGGAWYNDGVLQGGHSSPTINNCTFMDNHAISYGGAIYNNGSFGGLANPTYNNCQFSNNTAILGAAAIYNNGIFSGDASPNLVDCNFDNHQVSEGDGGAIFNRGSENGHSNPVLINCTFTNNTAQSKAGAVYNEGGNNGAAHAQFLGCNFENNEAENGGAVYNNGGFSGLSNPTFSGCNFKNNIAIQNGGGIYNDAVFGGESSPIFENCLVENNTAGGDGGGVFSSGLEAGNTHAQYTNTFFINNISDNNGGGLCHFGKGGSANPIFTDCGFSSNQAINGGGVYNDGSFSGESSPIFTNCTFDSNMSSVDGAALYNMSFNDGESLAEITNCKFLNNHSTFAGAGMFNNGIMGNTSPIITNCEFLNNIADTYGGGIYNQGKTGNSSPTIVNCLFSKNKGDSAGAIYNLGAENGNSSPNIMNCTFYSNRANVGGGIYSNASDATGTSSPLITNCIFYKNTANFGDVFRIIQGTPTIQNCLVDKDNCDELYSGMEGEVICGEGIIFNENPMFVDTAGGNFHLLATSPAIDVGNNSVIEAVAVMMDLDNHPRIQNGTVDFGVYEFMEGNTSANLTITQQPSDIELCEGEDIMITVEASSNEPISYQWQRNNEDLVNANQSVLTIPAAIPAVSGTYSVVISSGDETLVSNTITVQIHPIVVVSIDIFSNTTTLCGGEAINFWAETEGGGDNPTYEWRVNGNVAGDNSATFSPTNLTDGAVVSATLLSSAACPIDNTAVSNEITVSVGSGITASVQISATQTQICEGETVSFVADPINQGNAPIYEWFINNIAVGEDEATFTTTDLMNGDLVTCQMTSSETCVVENEVTSNGILLAVENSLEPSLTIATDSFFICQNSPVTFSTLAINAGDAVAFDWRINGESIGETESFLMINTLEDGDEVTCQMTSSIACPTVNPVLSNPLTIAVDPDCIYTNTKNWSADLDFELFPNPTEGQFTVEIPTELWGSELVVLDVAGRILVQKILQTERNTITAIDLTAGVYIVRVVKDNQVGLRKLIVL